MLETIIFLFIVGVVLLIWKTKSPKNYPPGPDPLPIIGNIHQLPKGLFFPAVDEWAKKYGPVVGLNLTGRLIVMINGVDHILEALRKEEFQGRPDSFSLRARSFGKLLGIFFSNGEQWLSSRKFVVKHLRSFGKVEYQNVMVDEISRLMDSVKDGVVQANGMFSVPAVNVIWTVMANKRFDLNDKTSRQFLDDLFLLFRNGNPGGGAIVNIASILRYVSPKFKFSQKVIKATQDYIRDTIQEHREHLDPNNPLDLIDHYLIEMERNSSPYFTEEDLIMIGNDLFTAGAETTSNSIEYVLLYMVLYPEVQRKMQEELDRVLGRSRRPTLEDKANLHYTMAVLSEVERVNSVVPTNVPHACTKDTTFGGYFIPKGTMISMNLRSLGYDPKYWKEPEEFRPERFLNSEGKYFKSSILATFGLGSRGCIGEVFARNMIFLFTSTFLEKYHISLPPGEPRPSTVPLPGFTTAPQPFRMTVKSRY